MNILIATETCSRNKNIEIDNLRKRNIVAPQQKFFQLMIEGLSVQKNVETIVLSALPVSGSTISQKSFPYQEETVGNASYHYIPFLNGKIARYFSVALSAKNEIKKWCREHSPKDSIVLVDPLTPIVSIPARMWAKKCGFTVGALVTDIPSLSSNMKGRRESSIKKCFLSVYQGISDRDLLKYDFYITLTESLNEVANVRKVPYCIIEGFADSKDTVISEIHENYIMYAGGIYEKFGVKALVDAFTKIDRDDLELWIFGDGPYSDEINKISLKDTRIKYKGCVSAAEIVEIEKRALLLVNPRPTQEEFAKYSFPSKTMEYLLSGTAAVSTRLPGIPDEYFEYLFAFEGDDEKSIEKGLREILACSPEQLIERGRKGHQFVLNNKSNTVMAGKMIDFFRSLI